MKFKRIAIPAGIRQTHPGARALGTIKQISYEEVTNPTGVRGSVAMRNVSLCFHCPFTFSANTDSGTVKHKIPEDVDLSLNRTKLIYSVKRLIICSLLAICYRIKYINIFILSSRKIHTKYSTADSKSPSYYYMSDFIDIIILSTEI